MNNSDKKSMSQAYLSSKRINKVILVVLLISLFFNIRVWVKTSVVNDDHSLLEQINILEAQLKELEGSYKELKDTLQSYNNTFLILQNRNNQIEGRLTNEAIVSEQSRLEGFKTEYDIFKVHSTNAFTMEREILHRFLVKKESSIEEKLDYVAFQLSNYVFGLPITVRRIYELNGKVIAEVNLEEHDILYPDISWDSSYFQGTTGSDITWVRLVDTFLQSDYSGPWIDGIQFFYGGSPIAEFEHMEPMANIIYK